MQFAREMGLSDRPVTVNREKLLTALQDNRRKHVEEYEQAKAGYTQQAKAKVEAKFSQLMASAEGIKKAILASIEDGTAKDTITVTQQEKIQLPVPKNYSSAYDVAIQAAEWEVNEEIELTMTDFQRFVMDQWDWKEESFTTNSMYLR